MPKIFIDPGHGGNDPGAVGNGLQEKNIVLAIALLIRNILVNEYENVSVRLSRQTDVYVNLTERVRLANEWGADYFLSIHVNAGGGTGFESYIHTSRSSGSVTAQNRMHTWILGQLGGVTDRGKKTANFAVLRETSMPAILTENLFIDQESDVAKLRDRSFLDRVARGHTNGLERAFGLRKSTPEDNQNDQLVQAVNVLQREGIINTPEYWTTNARKGRTIRGDYAAALIIKAAERLR